MVFDEGVSILVYSLFYSPKPKIAMLQSKQINKQQKPKGLILTKLHIHWGLGYRLWDVSQLRLPQQNAKYSDYAMQEMQQGQWDA